MNVHKILNGEGAEQYLPFALSKIRNFASWAKHAIVQQYTVDDARIVIEYNPQSLQHFIRIDRVTGTLGYEFFTTYDLADAFPVAWWATAVIPQPPEADVRLQAQKLSTAFTGEPTPVVPRDPLAKAVNGQRNAQYHWWPAADGVKASDAIRTKPYFMTSTNGCFSWQAADLDFQNFMGSYTTVDGQSAVPHDFLTDVGVDVAPTLYADGTAKSALPFPALPNWPRRAACMEVGGRRFVVMSDMHSTFYAYPASYLTGDPVAFAFHESRAKVSRAADYMPLGIARPTMATMKFAPRSPITEYGGYRWAAPPTPAAPILAPYQDYPGSTAEPGADERRQYQQHHYVWDFHPSGTRAVAVVHLAKNNGEAVLLRDDGASGLAAYCLREYGPQYQILAEHTGRPWVAEAGGVELASMCERGVLEVDFHIVLTGDQEDDFDFSVTPRRVLGNYWYFDAQYAYCDARLEARGVFAGDLLTDEIRLRGAVLGGAGSRPTVYDEFVVTRNQDRIGDVQSICTAQNRPYQMIQEYRPVEEVDVPTYPGDPPPIYRFFMLETASPGPNGVARLLSSDLRSMSKVFDQSRDGEPAGLHAVVFGQDRQGVPLPHTEVASQALGYGQLPANFLPSGSPWLGGDSVVSNSVDAAHSLGLHRVAWDHITYRYGFDASVHTGICTHPDGHFAVFAHYKNPYNPDAPVQPFDLIEYRRVVLDALGNPVEQFDQTTHQAALLEAFGVEFDIATFVDAINSAKPIVMQRFASWRNLRMPKVSGGQGTFTMNPRLDKP